MSYNFEEFFYSRTRTDKIIDEFTDLPISRQLKHIRRKRKRISDLKREGGQ